MTWDELVADVTARHSLHESKMFGMPCLKRENGKDAPSPSVTARSPITGEDQQDFLQKWKDGGLTVKLTDVAQREDALEAGAQSFDPGMGRVMKEWVLVPEKLSDEWLRLVEQAI